MTIKDAYPLPRIDDSLRLLGNQQWFSTMDLASGYWQVAMSPEAKRKAAFMTNEGLFQFRVMPFGLCNAPATFERLCAACDGPAASCIWMTSSRLERQYRKRYYALEEVLARLSEVRIAIKGQEMYFRANGSGIPWSHSRPDRFSM